MQLLKKKINLAASRLRTLVTVSGSLLTIIGVVSAADVETQILSQQTLSTLPHRVIQPIESSQPIIIASQITELASQSSIGEKQSIENFLEHIGATQEEKDHVLLTQGAYPPLTPISAAPTPPPKGKIKCSQGFGE